MAAAESTGRKSIVRRIAARLTFFVAPPPSAPIRTTLDRSGARRSLMTERSSPSVSKPQPRRKISPALARRLGALLRAIDAVLQDAIDSGDDHAAGAIEAARDEIETLLDERGGLRPKLRFVRGGRK
jgi:hypothetical protein